MYRKRVPILRMIAMCELILGVWELMQGVLLAYAVLSDMDGLIQMAQEMGEVLTKTMMFSTVGISLAGGIAMTAAGLLGMFLGGKEGKEKPPILFSYGLFVYTILADAVSVFALGGQISLSMLFPFLLHGFYLWAAIRNKKDLEAAAM